MKLYSSKVDVWAAGLIFYELLTQQPLFPTDKGELGVVHGIFYTFGVPDERTWSGISQLPMYKSVVQHLKQERGIVHPKGLRDKFPPNTTVSSSCLEFLQSMLMLCPDRRVSASEALQHPYLTTDEPLPCQPFDLPRFESEMSQKFAMKNKNNLTKIQTTL